MDYVLAFTLLGVAAAAYWLGTRQRSEARVDAAGESPAPADVSSEVAKLAGRIRLDPIAPDRTRDDPTFQAGVRRLMESGESSAQLASLVYSPSGSIGLACMALEVLAQRPADTAGVRVT